MLLSAILVSGATLASAVQVTTLTAPGGVAFPTEFLPTLTGVSVSGPTPTGSEVGVGSDGLTTWVIGLPASSPLPAVTATLAVGGTEAVLIRTNVVEGTVTERCGWTSSAAVGTCTIQGKPTQLPGVVHVVPVGPLPIKLAESSAASSMAPTSASSAGGVYGSVGKVIGLGALALLYGQVA